MSVAFWSATVTSKNPVEVQPPEGFVLNLQQAALVGAKKDSSAVLKVSTVAIEGDAIEAVIGTLRPITADQINLSLVFGYDVPATFTITGEGSVHLSGYYQPGPDDDDEEGDEEDFDGDSEDEDSEDDDEEEGNIMGAEQAKLALAAVKKMTAAQTKDNSKGKVVQLPSESEESSDDEEDEEEEEADEAFVQKMIAKTQLNKKLGKPATPAAKKSGVPVPESDDEDEEDSEEGSGEEDDSEEDGSEDDDEEDSESEEEEAPPLKVAKTVAKGVVTPSGANKNHQQNSNQNNKNNNNQNNKNNNSTPSKPAFGSGSNNNNNKQKTPQGGNFKQQMQHSGNKHHQSGDKRKR